MAPPRVPESGLMSDPASTDPTDVLGRRVGAALLDIVVLGVLFVILGLLIGDTNTEGSSASVNLSGGPALLFFALSLLYYFIPEATSGRTLGKRLLGLRVVREDGGAAGAGAVAGRTLLRVVDSLPLFYLVGFVAILATGKRRARIGDLAAGTRVVRG